MRSGKFQERALWISKLVRTFRYIVRRRTDEARNPLFVGKHPRLNLSYGYSQEEFCLRGKSSPTTEKRRRTVVAIQVHAA
jgi:hypothetical protein